MKLRWLLLITIASGFLIGPLIKDIPGFVVIALGDYTVQTRLWQAIVMVVILMLLFILGYHLIAKFWNSAGRFKGWSGGRRWKKSRQKTINGMIALAEGDWIKAEKCLTSAIPDSDTQLINYIAAAQAAQAQKADARRDNYLRQAHLAEPNAEIAIGLTQAQLQLNHGQYEQALATLTHLQNLSPKHGHVLLLLQKLYRLLGDWQRFLEIVPQLKKSATLSNADLESYQQIAWQKLLIREAARGGIEAIHSLWMTIEKSLCKEVALISCYAELLINYGADLEAEKLLRNNIGKLKNERLLSLYGTVRADDPSKQLIFVEGLHKTFSGSSIWLLTLGRLSINNELWGKAKTYLEQSIALKPRPEAYQALALALEALGETEAVKNCYREGLKNAIDKSV
ncbi:MAG: HemY protein [Enterobacterales bacterium]|jgi:HemY protein